MIVSRENSSKWKTGFKQEHWVNLWSLILFAFGTSLGSYRYIIVKSSFFSEGGLNDYKYRYDNRLKSVVANNLLFLPSTHGNFQVRLISKMPWWVSLNAVANWTEFCQLIFLQEWKILWYFSRKCTESCTGWFPAFYLLSDTGEGLRFMPLRRCSMLPSCQYRMSFKIYSSNTQPLKGKLRLCNWVCAKYLTIYCTWRWPLARQNIKLNVYITCFNVYSRHSGSKALTFNFSIVKLNWIQICS